MWECVNACVFVSVYEVIKISLMYACVRSWRLLSTLPLNRLMKSGCNVYSSSRSNVKSLLAVADFLSCSHSRFNSLCLSLSL